jgi:hypothetical protein
MSNPDQKYIRYPYVKFTNLKGENGTGGNGVSIGTDAGYTGQQLNAIAIGNNAGYTGQTSESVAIGAYSGWSHQQFRAIAIGREAGYQDQQSECIAIGGGAGYTNQNMFSIAIGYNSGYQDQQSECIAIGRDSGKISQGSRAVAIGQAAGYTSQQSGAIAIGDYAGYQNQGISCIAIGANSGSIDQIENSIAVGNGAGRFQQNQNAVAIGWSAGENSQGTGSVAIGYQAGNRDQKSGSIAIGQNSGYTNQQGYAVAVGSNAGYTNQGYQGIAIGNESAGQFQGEGSVAIGYRAAYTNQDVYSIAIGYNAASYFQQSGAIAIGIDAGNTSQSSDTVAIGNQSGNFQQAANAIAIGFKAGYTSQFGLAIAIGDQSGYDRQAANAIAIGFKAGYTSQFGLAIAIGDQSGYDRQGAASIAIGRYAGYTNQGLGDSSIAIGNFAGFQDQYFGAIAMGQQAGYSNQRGYSIAIGQNAGNFDQEFYAISMGYEAGQTFQGTGSVAIGYRAGLDSQQGNAIAIGVSAGNLQQTGALAIGYLAGNYIQGTNSVAVGTQAGLDHQQEDSIAIGRNAGANYQRRDSIAIGRESGTNTQGTNAIAIGTLSGNLSQHENTIILNATGNILNSKTQSAFYAAPIRPASTAANALYYNDTTYEIVYEGATVIETINLSNFGQTSKLNSIPYASNQQITTCNVVAKLDNWVDNAQTYTFGPTVQARYVAVGRDGSSTTAKSINYSADGLNWYAATSPFNTAGGYCNGIAYNGTVWVAVGSNVAVASAPTVTVAYSYDGISWINASGTTFTGTVGGVAFGVAWGKDKFVAVGCSASTTPVTNTCIYSYDGINWLAASNNIFGTGTGSVALGVCYNGSRWVVVGGQNVASSIPGAIVGYSANGITWTSGSGITLTAGGAFRSVAWNGTLFVMVGAIAALTPATTAAYSPDGITWTSTSTSGTNVFGAVSGASGFGICWNGSRWVAVGRSASTGATTLTINTSVNGLIWTTVSTAFTFNGTIGCGTDVCWTGTKFIAVGQNSTATTAPTITVLYSYDGTSWFTPLPATTGNPFSTTAVFGSGFGIAYNSARPNTITFPQNITIAVGYYVAGQNSMYYSTDSGTTWISCIGNVFGTTAQNASTTAYCIATNGDMWLVGGTGTAGGSLQTMGVSYDGINWVATQTSLNPVFTTNVRGIAWSPVLKIWVAVGAGTNQLAYSYNGITWIAVTSVSFGSSQGYCVAWGEDKFVAGGGNPGAATPLTIGNKLYYSLDGINWIVASPPLAVGIYGIEFNGTIWTCVGNNNGATALAYSYNGINWTLTVSTILNSVLNTGGAVAWSPPLNRWVAVGGNVSTGFCAAYSDNGTTWTAVTIQIGGGQGITWNGNRFLAGMLSGTGLVIYSSSNGITWTATSSTSSLSWSALAWSNNLPSVKINQPLIALGSGVNSIAYSLDGINWRGLGSTIFNPGSISNTVLSSSCWNGKIWLAGGTNSTTGVTAYSYDGINWTSQNNPILTLAINGIAWNGILFVAVGQGAGNSVAYSYDGIKWSGISGTQPFSTSGINVAWGQKYFVAVGQGATNNVAISTDGITWAGIGFVGGTGSSIAGIICGGNRWVLCGTTTGNASFVSYADNPTVLGNWLSATGSPAFPSSVSTMYTITYGFYPKAVVGLNTSSLANVFVLGMSGQGTTFRSYYSINNGVSWTLSTGVNGNADTIFTSSLLGITWSGNRFVGVGASSVSTGVTGYSYDGATWYQSVSPFTTYARAVDTNSWPTLGSVYTDNAITTSSTSGVNTNNQLDIFSDTYFNNGYNNMAVTIKATRIP